MEKQLSQQESMAVISEMIDRARNNISRRSGTSMVYYGYAVAGIALLNFALFFLLERPGQAFIVWWLMIPVVVVGMLLERRIDRSAIVRTQIDSIVGAVWRGFAISVYVFLAGIFAAAIFLHNSEMMLLCTPVIMLLAGAAEFTTAKACRFRPFLTGALVFWAGALLCVAVAVLGAGAWQMPILAVAMVTGFVIPGMNLNRKATGHV